MGRNGVTGIIVSLTSEVADRIFHHHEVYAMLSEKGTTELSEGDRFFLYDTTGKWLEGEASIEKVSFEPAREVRGYGHDLYLTGDELTRYLSDAGGDDDSNMLVLKVEDATKYSRPVKCSVPVGKDGIYVDPKLSAKILRENQGCLQI